MNRRKGTPKKKVQRRAPSAEKKSNKRARTGPAPTPAAKEAAATDEAASSSSPHKSSSAAESMGSAAATAAAAAAKPKNSIRGYFGGPAESPPTAASATSGVAALAGPTPRGRMFRRPSGAGVSAEELASAGSGGLCAADADSMRIDLGAAQKELAVEKSRAEAATKHADFLRQQLVILQDDLHGEREQRKVRTRKASMAIADILRVSMEEEMVEVRRAINADQFRLGRIVRVRKGHGAMEVWRDGQALKDLAREAKELEVRKERVEKRRKEIAKIARKAKADAKKAGASASGSASGAGGGGEKLNGMDAAALELLDSEETVKMQIASRKREETELAEKRRVLESEKRVYLRQLKRVRDEDSESLSRSVLARSSLPLSLIRVLTTFSSPSPASRFNTHPVLNDRYMLMRLIGRGGFSEVWKAYDLIEYREVACKIHQLNPQWPEEKKQSYTRHATREYNIHKVSLSSLALPRSRCSSQPLLSPHIFPLAFQSLRHDRIVQLFDVFEIDANSFATVLEFYPGHDLDYYLKMRKTLGEREARAIVIQVLSALQYMNMGVTVNDGAPGSAGERRSIIHYDLKPGNILLNESQVKITDFGLSKIIDESDALGSGMDLTSQGAGTYWYLPPECFVIGQAPPKISSKVDVWSLGVILFQMLFGQRPFGEGQTQERLLSERTILRAHTVNFPKEPKVSDACKEFIRRCLTHQQEARPNVIELCAHSYLQKQKGL